MKGRDFKRHGQLENGFASGCFFVGFSIEVKNRKMYYNDVTTNGRAMKIYWDENKNLINRQKHQIGFETAQYVFDDPLHISRQDRLENGELRWQTIGMVGGVALLLVAHTMTDDQGEEVIRIISARKADRKERRLYEQGC